MPVAVRIDPVQSASHPHQFRPRLRRGTRVEATGWTQGWIPGTAPVPSPGQLARGSDRAGDPGGQNVVDVPVELEARPVVAHRDPRVGMASADLDVSQ